MTPRLCRRRIDDGWTVAVTCSARSDSISSPRCCVTRKSRPKSDCAAVAPRQTITRGWTTSSSASSHGRHATVSDQVGFWWIRRLPRACHLKCLTAFVTYVCARSIPASSSALSSSRPAGPTKGLPARSSLSPGLLADEQHLGVRCALAEHRLRRVPVEVAPAAALDGFAQRCQRLAARARTTRRSRSGRSRRRRYHSLLRAPWPSG